MDRLAIFWALRVGGLGTLFRLIRRFHLVLVEEIVLIFGFMRGLALMSKDFRRCNVFKRFLFTRVHQDHVQI